MMFEEKIVKKVPGSVCPNPKEKQGYIEDLSSKTEVELLELLERQNKLLANKYFVRKLADKGEKIKAFRERLLKTLKEKASIEQACSLLSELSLSKGNISDEIEWTGKLTGEIDHKNDGDISEEDIDPLKIIATHAGTTGLKKKQHRSLKEKERVENVDESEVSTALGVLGEECNGKNMGSDTEQSLKIFHSASEIKPCEDLYAKNLFEKVDKSSGKITSSFKPYSTTKSGIHPGLHVPKHQGPCWEVTAATPPPPVHGAAKLLTLQESLQLQQVQAAKLKDIQTKHASEKLASSAVMKLGSLQSNISSRNEYRDTVQEIDSCNSSDTEDNDAQSDDDKRDTICYSYTE